MFSKIPPFFQWPQAGTSESANPSTLFSGVPLVNPLLNDSQSNIESLDERIAQMESVAQWLNLNLQMVNHSVQQLQVQKQTLMALAQWQEMSKDALSQLAKVNPFASAMSESVSADAEVEPPQSTAPDEPQEAKESKEETSQMSSVFEQLASSWWSGLQSQFAQIAQPLMEQAQAAMQTPSAEAEPTVRKATQTKAKAKPKSTTTTKARASSTTTRKRAPAKKV